MKKKRINITQAQLLGEFASLIYTLRRELSLLYDGTQKSLTDWVEYLKKLHTHYFAFSNEQDRLFQCLSQLALDSNKTYPFSTVHFLLKELVSQEHRTMYPNQIQGIRFCSLQPTTIFPTKVIFLIGMNHDDFPRKQPFCSFDLLKKRDKGDYVPSKGESDRNLFLEALISAREKLIISYQGRSPYDLSEKPPSILVSELLPLISKQQRIKHPSRRFDPLYFRQTNGQLKNYSETDYQMALCSLQKKKGIPSLFTYSPDTDVKEISEGKVYPTFPRMSRWTDGETNVQDYRVVCEKYELRGDEEITINIHELTRALQSPLKHYLHNRCGLRIQKGDRVDSEEAFVLSPLKRAILRRSATLFSLPELIQNAQKQGDFPFGIFGQLAEKQLEKEKIALSQVFNTHTFYSLEFMAHQQKCELVEEKIWRLPPLRISLSETMSVKVVGKIEGVTQEGLCVFEKLDLKGIIKIWPSFLVLNALKTLPDKLHGQSILFGRTGDKKTCFFQSPTPFLHALLNYYFWSQTTPSPLFPDWIEPILNEEPKKLEKAVEKTLSKGAFDASLNWALQGRNPFEPTQIIEMWSPWAKRLFGEMIDAWL